MNNYIYKTIIFILPIVFFTIIFSETLGVKTFDDKCADLTITLNKNEYLYGEPVWIELNAILNKKCKIDYQPKLRVGNDISLIIVSSNGDTLPYLGGISTYFTSKKIYDTLYSAYEINDGFGESETGTALALPVNDYTITAEIKIKSNKETKFYYSNVLTFKVIVPTGAEKKAHEDWVKIGRMKVERKSNDEIKTFVDEFHSNYPNSVYKDKVNSALLGPSRYISSLSPSDQKNFYITRINSNAESYHNKYYLASLKYLYLQNFYPKNYDKAIDFMNEIKATKRGTLLEKFCIEQIKEINASKEFEKQMEKLRNEYDK